MFVSNYAITVESKQLLYIVILQFKLCSKHLNKCI